MSATPGRARPPRRERAEYDRGAAAYDDRWAGYLRRSTRPVLDALRLRPGDRLLDVGCGTGALLEEISRRWPRTLLHGVDPSAGMLRRAAGRLAGRAHLLRAEATALPFADRAFAVVVSTSSLRYWRGTDAGLREIARVLAPGGRLLLVDWCGDAARIRLLGGWLARTGREAGRIHRRAELARSLSAAGFRAEVECVDAGWFWRLVVARATLEDGSLG